MALDWECGIVIGGYPTASNACGSSVRRKGFTSSQARVTLAMTGRFQSKSPAQCIMGRANFPVEILENIVNMVHHQSHEEKASTTTRKLERISHSLQEGSNCEAYLDHYSPPILNTFQSLAAVNRRFHRLCLPVLWQLVKSFEFEIEDLFKDEELTEVERSVDDNTEVKPSDSTQDVTRNGIGLMNIEKIFKSCSCLESVEIDFPEDLYDTKLFSSFIFRLKGLFGLIPQLKHLKVGDLGYESLPRTTVDYLLKKLPSLASLELYYSRFGEVGSTEKSLGWILAQHHNLRRLRLDDLDLEICRDLTASMVQKLLSGAAPCLTRLQVTIVDYYDEEDVDGQTDLPALEQLILAHHSRNFDLFVSFKGCKNIQMIKLCLPVKKDQWNLLKHFLSTHTWPKLSVLHLCNYHPYVHGTRDHRHCKKLTKDDVDEIWNSFKIKLVII
ncbi:uncharacterized protein MELLADRAFT_66825 [Melampsora larici-populina 98AG31]|uniref:F-box domain-containing protein n=1 Tax=Melampsora larici-populina (strain 98AG31 / pathotype 3-4-7) TaxID=747676 RepID=F4S0Q8_MELLP|nr:uncharacterized protein MELLADRAFT_66825 [Melampsora larici-populina 98AG31]EGG01805.1 hypothetical protein MELLADRAFT_66825 [Melampsora larici-populina 98AG31]